MKPIKYLKLQHKTTVRSRSFSTVANENTRLKNGTKNSQAQAAPIIQKKTGHSRFLQYYPHGHWKELSNQRKFFDDLGKKLHVQKMDDWYEKASRNTILEAQGGSCVLKRHHGSPPEAIMAVYPEYDWVPWKFNNTPQGFWSVRENRRKYFDWLGKELGIQKLDDWYNKISRKVVTDHHGGSLLVVYNGSPTAALVDAYPEHNWVMWNFSNLPKEFWRDAGNRRKFFDDLGAKLGIKELDDWYEKLSVAVIVEHGGITLVQMTYKGSAIAALADTYPEHKWLTWKFAKVSRGCWNSSDNITQFLADLSEKLCIQTLDDWYRVDRAQLQHFGGAALVLSKYKTLYSFLKHQYPNHPWDRRKFQQRGRKTQRWLVIVLKKIFPNEEVIEDYLHPKASFIDTNRPMQLDVFIPGRSLAFEYQGIQHYQEVGLFSPSRVYQQRDEEKRALCAANNIKLIEVPYWWNRTQESLEELIQKSTPLLP